MLSMPHASYRVALDFPPLLWGRVRVGGAAISTRTGRSRRHPSPPPQPSPIEVEGVCCARESPK